jgi:predicted HNH restriction endonuclease
MYGVDVSEAHHIQPFSLTANNDAKNVMIVCPDHHRIIHKAKPVFNYDQKAFLYNNGREDRLMYNIHL